MTYLASRDPYRFWPRYLPDESLLSFLYRLFLIEFPLASPRHASRILFGRRAVLVKTSGNDLKALRTRAPKGLSEISTLIWDHTPYPYVAPFDWNRSGAQGKPSRFGPVLRSLFGLETEKNLATKRSNSNIQYQENKQPRYCATCVREDREKFGLPYWHRMHQVKDISVCAIHRCLLQSSCPHCGPRPWRTQALHAPGFCDACGYDFGDSPVGTLDEEDPRLRFARYVEDAFSHISVESPLDRPTLIRTINFAMRNLGLESTSQHASCANLFHFVGFVHGTDFVKNVHRCTQSSFRLVNTSIYEPQRVVWHLVISSLFGSYEMMLHTYRYVKSIDTPSLFDVEMFDLRIYWNKRKMEMVDRRVQVQSWSPEKIGITKDETLAFKRARLEAAKLAAHGFLLSSKSSSFEVFASVHTAHAWWLDRYEREWLTTIFTNIDHAEAALNDQGSASQNRLPESVKHELIDALRSGERPIHLAASYDKTVSYVRYLSKKYLPKSNSIKKRQESDRIRTARRALEEHGASALKHLRATNPGVATWLAAKNTAWLAQHGLAFTDNSFEDRDQELANQIRKIVSDLLEHPDQRRITLPAIQRVISGSVLKHVRKILEHDHYPESKKILNESLESFDQYKARVSAKKGAPTIPIKTRRKAA